MTMRINQENLAIPEGLILSGEIMQRLNLKRDSLLWPRSIGWLS
jgi:hypothetical protein